MQYHLDQVVEVLGCQRSCLTQFLRRLRAQFPDTPSTRFSASDVMAIDLLRKVIEENPRVALRYAESVFSVFRDVCQDRLPSGWIGFIKETNKAEFLKVDQSGLCLREELLRSREYHHVDKLCLDVYLGLAPCPKWHGLSADQIDAKYESPTALPNRRLKGSSINQ